MQIWKISVVFALAFFTLTARTAGDPGSMQQLSFIEVLEVVSIGVQMEKQSSIDREPSMAAVYRDASQSLESVLEERVIDPDELFGKLQQDLGHHGDRLYAVFLQDFWDVMELYRNFYALNSELRAVGVRTPFEAFVRAIRQGLRDEAASPVFIAGDGGAVNPMNMLDEKDLIFVSW